MPKCLIGAQRDWWRTTVRFHQLANGGNGNPAHPLISAALAKATSTITANLALLRKHSQALHSISHEPTGTAEPFWSNGWFSTLDAASLVTFILERRPKQYIEIGSGYSTRFCRFAIKFADLSTHLLSIDPEPRADIDGLCNQVMRVRLEQCELSVFEALGPGDILFLDGSHRAFANSDVVVFFLEILPRLKRGVLVHIHDIFLPFDYIKEWSRRFYSEQYLLGAMLLCDKPSFRVMLPNHYVCNDEVLAKLVKDAFRSPSGGPDIPFLYARFSFPGVSFWLEKT